MSGLFVCALVSKLKVGVSYRKVHFTRLVQIGPVVPVLQIDSVVSYITSSMLQFLSRLRPSS